MPDLANNERCRAIKDELNNIFYDHKDYYLCLEKTKEFETYLHNNGVITKSHYQYLHMMYAKIYYRIKDYNLTLEHTKKAEKFSTTELELSFVYWQYANYYFDINKNKVLYYYDLCERYYRKIDDKFYLAQTIFNKAELLNDVKLGLQALDLYKQFTDEELKKYKYTKDKLFDTKYSVLFKIYINGHVINRQQKAWQILHNIKDTKIKEQLCNQMLKHSIA